MLPPSSCSRPSGADPAVAGPAGQEPPQRRGPKGATWRDPERIRSGIGSSKRISRTTRRHGPTAAATAAPPQGRTIPGRTGKRSSRISDRLRRRVGSCASARAEAPANPLIQAGGRRANHRRSSSVVLGGGCRRKLRLFIVPWAGHPRRALKQGALAIGLGGSTLRHHRGLLGPRVAAGSRGGTFQLQRPVAAGVELAPLSHQQRKHVEHHAWLIARGALRFPPSLAGIVR